MRGGNINADATKAILALAVLLQPAPGSEQVFHSLVSPKQEGGGAFGDPVVGLGDIDNDGFGDVGIGAMWEDLGTSPEHAGRAYIFCGYAGESIASSVSPNEAAPGFLVVPLWAAVISTGMDAPMLSLGPTVKISRRSTREGPLFFAE